MGVPPALILKQIDDNFWVHENRTSIKNLGEGLGKSQRVRSDSSRHGSGQYSKFSGEKLEHGASI